MWHICACLPHLALEELFNIPTVGFGVSCNVYRARRGLLHPQFYSSADLCQIREAHGHGERQGCLAVVANTLR